MLNTKNFQYYIYEKHKILQQNRIFNAQINVISTTEIVMIQSIH